MRGMMRLAIMGVPGAQGAALSRIIPGPVAVSIAYGAELLPDPSLEANYTDGRCDTLTVGGSPTLAQSADAHSGSKAQQFTATANIDRIYWSSPSMATGSWVAYTVWSKRTAGSAGEALVALFNGTGTSRTGNLSEPIDSADYTQRKLTTLMTGTGAMACYLARQVGTTGFDTIISDDGSFRVMTGLMQLYAHPVPYGEFSAKITRADNTQAGLVINADAAVNPTTYDHIYLGGNGRIYRDKVIGGTRTPLTDYAITYVPGAILAVTRYQDGTLDIRYNGVAVATGLAASGATGTYWGFFATDEASTATDLTVDSRSTP